MSRTKMYFTVLNRTCLLNRLNNLVSNQTYPSLLRIALWGSILHIMRQCGGRDYIRRSECSIQHIVLRGIMTFGCDALPKGRGFSSLMTLTLTTTSTQMDSPRIRTRLVK